MPILIFKFTEAPNALTGDDGKVAFSKPAGKISPVLCPLTTSLAQVFSPVIDVSVSLEGFILSLQL